MSVATVLLGILAAVAEAFRRALAADDDAERLAAAREALLDAVSEVESAQARAKFPELREGP